MNSKKLCGITKTTLLVSTILISPRLAQADHDTVIDGNNGTLPTPTGQYVTPQILTGFVQQPLNPQLPNYPSFVAGEAVRSQLSPDGSTLAIICAGMNSLVASNPPAIDVANSTQYVFLYNVAGANKTAPALSQVIKQTNSFVGLVFSPDGSTLYATGGKDDVVDYYTKTGTSTFALGGSLALNHAGTGIGSGVAPNAGGLGISADGTTLVVANNYNDSISVIDTASKAVVFEHDLRPFAAGNEGTSGAPGGTFPYTVMVTGTKAGGTLTAYVSSDRDREVDVVNINAAPGTLIKRIALDGNGMGMTLSPDQSVLYVAEENQDKVALINTATNTVTTTIDTRAPAGVIADSPITGGRVTGAGPSAVTLLGSTLYAVNSQSNTIAVIPLTGANANSVTGLIPTAYEPHDITFSSDGTYMYIINGKSDTGPNPDYLYGNTPSLETITIPPNNNVAYAVSATKNQYQFQLEHATLVSGQVPGSSDLPALTAQAELNNGYSPSSNPYASSDAAVMAFVRSHIQHVIYIVKENRTFDQILGDLGNGSNGDAALTMFGKRITPSFHALSNQFVTLDNFMDPGDGSMDGWSWSMAGRVTNTETITQQINYALVNRGLSYESEGENRNVPVGVGGVAQRDYATNGSFSSSTAALPGGPANVLVGPGNHSATDAPFGYQLGYIFDAVLQAGDTVRDYGFMVNNIGSIGTNANPVIYPYAAGVVQVAPVNPKLLNMTDVYFRGFDQNYPDLWRVYEWQREFHAYDQTNTLPSLSLVRLSHDHTGNFSTALAGVNTPERQEADDDYSVGVLVQTVANSKNYSGNTLILVVEDDSQDGPDHFDSHRTTAYVVGPYVKKGAVISTRYNQVSMLRTIEDIFNTPHINLNTAYQRPLADVFDTTSNGSWSFTPIASRILANTMLMTALEDSGKVQFADGPDIQPTHDAAYWARVTRGFDFSEADRVPPDLYNEVLWAGMMHEPYPTHRSGVYLGRRDVVNP